MEEKGQEQQSMWDKFKAGVSNNRETLIKVGLVAAGIGVGILLGAFIAIQTDRAMIEEQESSLLIDQGPDQDMIEVD